jgi:type VI secretion system secreted protein Hcp
MATAMYVQFQEPSIDGESMDSQHEKWIEVQSFNWGVAHPIGHQTGTYGSVGAGRADFQDFSFTKLADSASPLLYKACAQATDFSTVVFEIVSDMAGKKLTVMMFVFEDCTISSISPGGSSGDAAGRPMESVSLFYRKITWHFQPVDDTGKVGTAVDRGWNIQQNSEYTNSSVKPQSTGS